MTKSSSFKDLIVWQKAHQWVLEIYHLTKIFPREELFGITSQLRRAAVSITANIVEGFKRTSRLEKARFFNIAQSPLEECRYYLILVNDLRLCFCKHLEEKLEIISKMLEKYYSRIVNSGWL